MSRKMRILRLYQVWIDKDFSSIQSIATLEGWRDDKFSIFLRYLKIAAGQNVRGLRRKNSSPRRINGSRERRWRFCCHWNVQERPEDRNSARCCTAWHGARDNHRPGRREEKIGIERGREGARVGQPLTSDSTQKPGPPPPPLLPLPPCVHPFSAATLLQGSSRIRWLENLSSSNIAGVAAPCCAPNKTETSIQPNEKEKKKKESKKGNDAEEKGI